MLYVPLTSLFWPIVSLPENAERVLGPPMRLLQKVAGMVKDGTQLDLARDIGERMLDGRGVAFGWEVRDFVLRKTAETRAAQLKRWEAAAEQVQQAEAQEARRANFEQRVAEVKAGEEAARVAKMGKGKENEK